jgi:hypothetical protein
MNEKPTNPKLVLLASLLPGAGHVMLGLAPRGLQFLFFMLIFGWLSLRLMPEHMSFFARHVGGIFIYGVSIQDAYRIALRRFHGS